MTAAWQEVQWAFEDIHARIDELQLGSTATLEERARASELAAHLDDWDDKKVRRPASVTEVPSEASTPTKAATPTSGQSFDDSAGDSWHIPPDYPDDSTGFESEPTRPSTVPFVPAMSSGFDLSDDSTGFE